MAGALCGLLLGALFLKTLPLAELHPVFLLALPLTLLLVLGFILKPKAVLALVIFTRCLLDPVLELTKGGNALGFGAVLNLFVVFMAVSLILKDPGILRSSFAKRWLVFLFICGMAVLYAPFPVKAFRVLFNLSSYFCMALLPSLIDPQSNDKRYWVKVLIASAFLPVLMADIDLLKGGKIDETAGLRVYGTFTHPNILAFYLLWVIAMIFYVNKSGLFRPTGFTKFVLGGFFLNVLALLIATKTRNAWIGAWLFFLIYGILKEKKYLIGSLSMVAAALVLPPILVRFGDLFQHHSNELNSFAWRLEVWRMSLPVTMERWAFGHGLASFRDLSGAFLRRNPLVTSYNGVEAHNIYLQLWFECGLFGLLAYLSIYWNLVRAFFARFKYSAAGLSREYAVVLSYTIVYLISGFADNLLSYLAINWYCWFFWGVLLKTMRFQRLAWVAPRARESGVAATVV